MCENKHGYILDKHGQPTCDKCREATNKQYVKVPTLTCWNCGALMPKITPGGIRVHEVTVKISLDSNGTIRVRRSDLHILESPFHFFDSKMAMLFDSIFGFDVQNYLKKQKTESEGE